MRFWQAVAFLDTEELLAVAKAADEAGYDAITLSDHIFYPQDLESKYPYSPDGSPIWAPDTPWPDPWVAIGAMAAVTERLRFATNVYIAPARDVFTVAKLVSTAAVLSRDRVALGLAPGWCREEFEQTGQDFSTRGKRLDEMIPVLRQLWSGDWTEHHGRHYDFGPLRIAPAPKERIPIYVGGHSPAALRRAARLADGWIGNVYTPDDAEAKLAEVRAHLSEAGRADDDSFEVVLALLAFPDVDLFRRFEDLGVTAMLCAPWMMADVTDRRFSSPFQARMAAIEEFAETVVAKMR